ncbi:mitochondrial carrier homolog 2-like [Sabethes cyaneus]|uniref:mitochondrial carrier homolog 2-like n=1 Tax=Sabethes cyaneus TaxID=53552 RepID=UPI00237EA6C8|nr:mitochondrial carrier homolog 2-like [Sabethes cyaneus]
MLALIQQKVKQYELTEYTDIKTWNRLGVRLGTITVLHPYEYARVLMQIGYEPIAPLPGRTLLGTPTLYLPNMFQYVAHIRGVDGFFGCFRGLSCKILGDLLSTHFSGKIVDRLEITGSTIYKPVQRKFHGFIDELDEDLETNHVQFKKNLKRNLAIQAVCVIISHPFELIAVRMMAEFVGQDQLYSSLWQSIGEIWTQNGLSGFYSGVVPRLLCELGCLVMSSSVTYLAFRYALRKRQERACFSAFSKLLASSIHYPYKVVSTRMIVTFFM